MSAYLRIIVLEIIVLVEACGAIVVFLGVGKTIVKYLRDFFGRKLPTRQVALLRLQLGQSMVMGLEFQVAADILKTTLSPNWNDVLLLSAIIALRTVLNYLLEREMHILEVNSCAISP